MCKEDVRIARKVSTGKSKFVFVEVAGWQAGLGANPNRYSVVVTADFLSITAGRSQILLTQSTDSGSVQQVVGCVSPDRPVAVLLLSELGQGVTGSINVLSVDAATSAQIRMTEYQFTEKLEDL